VLVLGALVIAAGTAPVADGQIRRRLNHERRTSVRFDVAAIVTEGLKVDSEFRWSSRDSHHASSSTEAGFFVASPASVTSTVSRN